MAELAVSRLAMGGYFIVATHDERIDDKLWPLSLLIYEDLLHLSSQDLLLREIIVSAPGELAKRKTDPEVITQYFEDCKEKHLKIVHNTYLVYLKKRK